MLLKQHKLINVRYTRIPDFRFLITFTADPIYPLSFLLAAMWFSPSLSLTLHTQLTATY